MSRCASLLLIFILLGHTVLGAAYSVVTPLGEAPDEPAHFDYAQFIGARGRLPATLNERKQAGYRAVWPPLYHVLVAAATAPADNGPPTRLKSVGDSPRRLIPTNGQTIASFIHTHDERWPWRGVVQAWHIGRLLSALLSTLAVGVTWLIVQKLTRRQDLALSAAAVQAFIPQFLFVGAVVSDDTLLVLLSALVLLALVTLAHRDSPTGWGGGLLLGGLLGLATVTKYNALPLWGVALLWWVAELLKFRNLQAGRRPVGAAIGVLAGAALAGGWWFVFVWRNFNRVDELGPVAGSLAALTAGTADASLRQLSAGGAAIPPPAAWLEWGITLFKSFWGMFGGGGSIEFPEAVYAGLALISILALAGFLKRQGHIARPTNLFLLTPLFFLPLPALRFALSGNLVETAQGRHLFPALPAIALGLVLGLARWGRIGRGLATALPLLLLALSLFGLTLIHSAYPPPIPLRTEPQAATAENSLNLKLTGKITLVGVEPEPAEPGILPLTLVWRANGTPSQDYMLDLTAVTNGQPVGSWRGQPLGGRYPTRAWDAGDVLRDTVRLPLLPGTAGGEVDSLVLRLLDQSGQTVAEQTLAGLNLTAVPANRLLAPGQLRSDGLPAGAPFTYRGTLSFLLPGAQSPPELVAPTGQTIPPDHFLPGGIAHFTVAAHWPSGEYQLTHNNTRLSVAVKNRPRRFDSPAMQSTVNANFAGVVTLLGYDLPQSRVHPGESFPLALHLRAEQPLGRSLAIFNHLLDAQAVQRGGADRIPKNYYTTLLWVPGEIVSDQFEVPVDADAPPGVYWLDVGLYPTDSPTQSLPLVADGRPIDRNSVSIGPIKVGGPPPDVIKTSAQPQHPANATFGDQITLLGFDVAGPAFTLYWRAERIPQADFTVFIHLQDRNGQFVSGVDSPPAEGHYPTRLWDPGEIIADRRLLPDVPPGEYSVVVGLYRTDTGERLPLPGSPDGTLHLLEMPVNLTK